MNHKIKILGHRGYRAKYPENTLKSFRKAIEAGADGVEFDVQKTKDGVYVVFHDHSLKRMLKIEKKINDLTFKDLSKKKMPSGQSVSSLEETLKSLPSGKIVNAELKYETVGIRDLQNIFDIMVKNISPSDLIVSSFSHEFLPFFKKRGIRIGMLLGKNDYDKGIIRLFFKILLLRPDSINVSINTYQYFNRNLVNFVLRIWKLTGKHVAFYTVNQPEQFDIIKGVANLIFTDEVELMIKYAREKDE